MWNKLIEKAYKIAQNPDKVLIIVGAVGWIISMFAQITAVKTNKKLSEDKRKVLLAQETADGLANTALYAGVTSVLTLFTKNQVAKGNLITKELATEFSKTMSKTGKKFVDIANEILTTDEFGNMSRNTIDSFKNFYAGAGMVATIVGSVLSVNIASPLVRNKIGNYYQQKVKSADIKNNPIKIQPTHSTTKTLTPPAFTKNTTFATFSNITKI